MKLKTLKEATLRRQGYVKIKDITFPISTKGITEVRRIMRELKYLHKLPMKIVPPNKDELNALKGFGYDVNKLNTMVNRVDEASDKYKEYINSTDELNLFIGIATQVDLLHPIGDDPTLWKHLGLKGEGDVLGLAKWLSSLGMDTIDKKAVEDKIDVIKGSHVKEYKDWIKVEENGK